MITTKLSYDGWYRALIPVDYDGSPFSSQANKLNEWLKVNVGRENFTFPINQESGYWTFYLKNQEDAVRFSLVWA